MRRHFLASAVIFLALAPCCFAPPPLVTGDVPTADKGRFEWYAGARYQESESGKPAWLLPFTELVYGLSDRQELTFETAGLSKDGHYGPDRFRVGHEIRPAQGNRAASGRRRFV